VDAFKAFLKSIDCPTLVVSGGPAGWHPADEEERIACLASATRFELPNAGHMMHWTEPTALSERLASFFAEPTPRRPKRAAKPDPQAGTELPLSAQGAMPVSTPGSSHARHAVLPGAPLPGAPLPGAPLPGAAGGPSRSPKTAAPLAGQAPVGPTRPAAGIHRDGGRRGRS
jgi:hypothetical protein